MSSSSRRRTRLGMGRVLVRMVRARKGVDKHW
jgi:hypothetical protein